MKSQKIAIDVSQMVYSGTGVGRYTRGLAKALLELKTDHEFTFYAGVLRQYPEFVKLSHSSPWDQAKWRIYPLPPRVSTVLFNQMGLSIDPFIGHVDLLHTSDWTEPSSGVPKVTTVHDLVFRKYPETVDPLVLRTQELRMKNVLNSATHIITDSMSTKNDLVSIYKLPTSKIDVVYPGIEDYFKPAASQEVDRVKNKYNLPSKYMLALGTKEPRKNLDRLITAIQDLDIPLVITGRSGWGEKLAASSRVIETGYVDDADLPALYSGATVFAFPSLYEGFGFPVLEAMACGAPVVTSNISSLPEVVGDAAILVDPMDVDSIKEGIQKAIKNAKDLQTKGFKQAAKFTWVTAAKQTLKVYEKLLTSK